MNATLVNDTHMVENTTILLKPVSFCHHRLDFPMQAASPMAGHNIVCFSVDVFILFLDLLVYLSVYVSSGA